MHPLNGHRAQEISRPDAPPLFEVADERRATVQAMNAWMAARRSDDISKLGDLFDGSRQIGDSEFLTRIDEDPPPHGMFMVCGDNVSMPLSDGGVADSADRATDSALPNMFREACAEAVRGDNVVFREGGAKTEPDIIVNYRCNFMPVRSDTGTGIIYVFGAYGTRASTAAERAVA